MEGKMSLIQSVSPLLGNHPCLKKMSALVVLTALFAAADSSRILAFFPFPAKSHHFVFRPILEELGKRGHEVVYVTGQDYDKPPPPGIKQISIAEYIPDFNKEKSIFSWVSFGELSVPENVVVLYEIGLKMAPMLLGNPKVQQLIHSDEKFDAVLLESFFVQEYEVPLIHKFGAVGIEVMPLGDCAWVNELSGLPDNTAAQQDFKKEHTNNMDFFSRLHNVYVTWTTILLGYMYMYKQQAMADKYLNYTGWENRPSLYEMVTNKSLILTNSHFAVGYPVPLAPHRREIGGVHIKPNKPLPKDLEKYMDDSKHGVIYMSLGSNMNVSDVANEYVRENFMSVFKGLKENVLLKWETDYPGQIPPNVLLSKWFPQQDILAHKNCVLFITHGGYLSISEAVHFGVPLVGIPVFGDQAKNLVIVEEAGYGRMLRLRNITTQTVSWTVKEVLYNKKYKEEALRRSKLLRDRRQSPAEDAAYWIEHAIKYPNALTPKAASLSFVQLHLIDVKLFIASMFLLVLWAGCRLLGLLAAIGKSRPKEEPKKKAKKS